MTQFIYNNTKHVFTKISFFEILIIYYSNSFYKLNVEKKDISIAKNRIQNWKTLQKKLIKQLTHVEKSQTKWINQKIKLKSFKMKNDCGSNFLNKSNLKRNCQINSQNFLSSRTWSIINKRIVCDFLRNEKFIQYFTSHYSKNISKTSQFQYQRKSNSSTMRNNEKSKKYWIKKIEKSKFLVK